MLSCRRKVLDCGVDETLLKVGSEYVWSWVAIDAKSKEKIVLLQYLSPKKRNMFVAERFTSDLVKNHRIHPVSTDGCI